MKYYFKTVRMAIIKQNKRCVDKIVDKMELFYTVGGNVNDTAIMEHNMEAPQKIKIKLL